MKLTLNRYLLDQNYTMGKLSINGVVFCDTLEDRYRGDNLKDIKVNGKTAIPCGHYEVCLSKSVKFKTILPEIKQVPFFTGIRIHSGNTEIDTDGCILVGKKTKDGFVGNSRDTLQNLMRYLNDAKIIELDIKIGW